MIKDNFSSYSRSSLLQRHEKNSREHLSPTPPSSVYRRNEGVRYDNLKKLSLLKQVHSNKHQPRVAILLSTFEGEKFLSEQLKSIMEQSYKNWSLYASDDCSSDKTFSVLKQFQNENVFKTRVKLNDTNQGFLSNFLTMVCDSNIKADLYAFSDQDDVWETEKLQKAVSWIKQIPQECPALYCSRTTTVDEYNNPKGFSPLFTKPPSFKNAIVQSIGGGNTMLFNQAARELIAEAGVDVEVASHDWWTYMLVSGCGGAVFYDQESSLRYRQHDNNFIGTNNNFYSRLVRINMLVQGRFKNWNNGHISALSRMKHRLTDENIRTFDLFVKSREGSIFSRLLNLYRSRVYRQTVLGNIGLVVASLFKKL